MFLGGGGLTYFSRLFFCVSSLVLCHGFATAANIEQSVAFIESSTDYVEIKPDHQLQTDLRYATTNNFVGENLYGDFNRAYLHRLAAKKLIAAKSILKASYPEYKLVIFDAMRPRSVQYQLWDKVKGTDKQGYVANPAGGSIHNYGFAVDISLADAQGNLLDMGTKFDDFTALAQPRQEAKFIKSGLLSEAQLANRKILRSVMEKAGFIQLSVEWWHFDALPKKVVKSTYQIIE